MRKLTAVWIAPALCAVSMALPHAAANAQSMSAMPGMETGTPPDQLPRPVKISGIGNSTLAITTSSEAARQWLLQGLNLLHDFWDYESARAFQQAIREDPKCAMCYWGLYKAEAMRGMTDEYAGAALKHAEQLARHAPPNEKLYIQAAKEEFKAHQKQKNNQGKSKPGGRTGVAESAGHIDSAETKVLRKLVARYPDDIQARIFLAESVIEGFTKDGGPKPGTAEAQSILSAILAAHPDDSAANHYWIHAQEPGQHPEAALESARKLASLAPSSGHMVHMPGHIFYRTGDYDSARTSFESSARVDETYMRNQHVSPDDDWNYVHNLMYLIADLLEAGRLNEATEYSAKLNHARGTGLGALYRQSTRDGMTRLDPLLPVALRSADWSRATELLNASHPPVELKNLVALRTNLLDYTRGMAALASGDLATAGSCSDSLATAVAVKPVDPPMNMPGMRVSKDAMGVPVHSFLDVASQELHAALLMAQGKSAEADAAFAKATDAERALGYREPPYYIRPVAETRGDALMRSHRYADAKKAYQAALEERPNSGFPLYGIAQADAAARDATAARADFAAFLKAWSNADSTLPQIASARAWLTSKTTLTGN